MVKHVCFISQCGDTFAIFFSNSASAPVKNKTKRLNLSLTKRDVKLVSVAESVIVAASANPTDKHFHRSYSPDHSLCMAGTYRRGQQRIKQTVDNCWLFPSFCDVFSCHSASLWWSRRVKRQTAKAVGKGIVSLGGGGGGGSRRKVQRSWYLHVW